MGEWKLGLVAVGMVLLGAGCRPAGETTAASGVAVRYFAPVTAAQARSAMGIVARFNPGIKGATARVWREGDLACVTITAWDGRAYQRALSRPGASVLLSQSVFAGAPACIGFDGDSGIQWPRECTGSSRFDACVAPS